MVIFISQKRHQYAAKAIQQISAVSLVSYDQLFASKKLKAATYIFSDLDRLSLWELELAGRFYATLRENGLPVLNNPSTVKQRFALLRALQREGINTFSAYRPSMEEWPARYPVFIRRDAFHDGALTDLIYDRETLEEQLQMLVAAGIPQMNTMVVEYAAEPLRDDIFLKYALFRMGDSYFHDTSVTDRKWEVKYGQKGCFEEEDFVRQLEVMRTVPHREVLQKAFEIANIEFGRVDYGLLNGQPQIYEINTNPTIKPVVDHHSPYGVEARKLVLSNVEDAVRRLDSYDGKESIMVEDRMLRKQARRESLFQRSRPTL